MTKRISLTKDIELTAEYDVAVCGGGPAGCAAAIAAASQGAKTILIEKDGYLGGAVTSQLVGVVLSTNAIDFQGIWHRFATELNKVNGIGDWHRATTPFYPKNSWFRNSVDPERVKQVWDGLLQESNVDVLHFSTVIDVVKDNDLITELIIYFRGNKYAIKANQFIDSSGNGDLAHLAGCSWHRGVRDKPWSQAVSLVYNCSKSGVIDFGGPGTLGRRLEQGGRVDQKKVDPLDPVSVSDATRELRKRIWHREFDGYLISTAADLGVRTSRIVNGIDQVTDEDAWNLVKKEDAIARSSWEIDVHPPDESEIPEKMFHSKSALYAERAAKVAENDWFDIPYGAIVAKDVDNLFIVGRITSSELLAQGSLRIQQTCMATSEAAGVAASMCVDTTRKPSEQIGSEVVVQIDKYRKSIEDRYLYVKPE